MSIQKLMKDIMGDINFKVSIEGTGQDVVTELQGNKMLVEAGLITLIKTVADHEDKTLVEKLTKLLEDAKKMEAVEKLIPNLKDMNINELMDSIFGKEDK